MTKTRSKKKQCAGCGKWAKLTELVYEGPYLCHPQCRKAVSQSIEDDCDRDMYGDDADYFEASGYRPGDK